MDKDSEFPLSSDSQERICLLKERKNTVPMISAARFSSVSNMFPSEAHMLYVKPCNDGSFEMIS